MDTLRFCPQCQQPLPANAPEGLCPQCLLAAAVAPPSEPQPVTTSGGDIPDIGDPAAVGKCLPQFEIHELLGRGGMGVVYKARQLNLDRIVALKILPPVDSQSADFVERFRREARSLAKLSHPNIVAVHDFGESGGLYYFAMEFVDGVNLREMIRTGKMKPEEALAVVPKICDALQFAHEEGVVHRDIKPENILMDKRGRVKIADFGLAKLLRREHADHTLTMTGMTLGTPRYMAPEQLDKPETVDHRADIYSLGVVFYEMLTGEVPMGRFAPPSEKVRIDVRLDEIVLHALERDADRRYQHVSQVRDDVERVTSKAAVQASPVAQPVPAVGPAGILPASSGSAGGTPAGPTGSKPVPQPAAAQFLRSVLWLAVVVGAVMFCWFEKITYSGSNGFTAIRIGAVKPWLILGDPFTSYAPDFLTVSGLAGIGALIALIALFSFRPPKPASADKPATAARPRHLLSALLVLLCLFGFFFGFSFHAKHAGTSAGLTKLITVGAVDPIFVSESGPSGFQTGLNFFSWSFFAVVVAGIAFGALWRIGREDQGKVPRDAAWWRDWWKQVGVWGGLLLTVCIVRTAMDPAKVLQPSGDRTVSPKFAKVMTPHPASPDKHPTGTSPTPGTPEPPKQPFMIGLTGPELTNEAMKTLNLSQLQINEINRIVMAYHRDYLALQWQHSKVGKDDAGRIVVTIEPFYEECLALAKRLQTELGGIVDPVLLPVVKDGALAFQIFNWGGAYNETIILWKADGKYFVEEKLTSSPGHERDPFTFNISGPKLEEIPEAFRIFWREN